MSLLYKRPNSPYWYVTKTRQSTKTSNRKLAEEFAKKSLTERWRKETLGEEIHTWKELVEHWLDRKEGYASLDQDSMVIDRMTALLLRQKITLLADISSEFISEYARETKARSSASTANRHLNTIRAMLRRAHKMGWIHTAPIVEAYHVTKVEAKWLTIEQFNTILPHLPEWVADMAIFAVQTGLRFANVAGFQWRWISSDEKSAVVPSVETKAKRTHTVLLSSVARELLTKLRAKQSNLTYVFVGKRHVGRPLLPNGSRDQRASSRAIVHVVDVAPVLSVRHWWEAAREKAGFPDIRWHDLRHTWASLHVQNGTPDRILAKMGGWTSTRMLDNYAHLSTAHLAPYVDNVNGPAAERASTPSEKRDTEHAEQ